MRFALAFFIFTSIAFASNKGPITWDQYRNSKYFQLGISGGTPAGINLCIGYWFDEKFDYKMLQFCAMHFGSTLNGLQLDYGTAFYRTKYFRSFYAVSVRHSHVDLTGTPVDFTGIGPSLGFNWYYFALELGISAGIGKNTQFFPYAKAPNAGSRLALQLQFQIGIKGLFWQ